MKNTEKPCTIEGCSKLRFRGVWCAMHHSRWKVHGDPLKCGTSPGQPTEFLLKAVRSDTDGCILWPFAISSNGYGSYYQNRKYTRPHLVACRMAHGEKPFQKAEAAHACGTRACINPKHLRWATRQENESDKLPHGTRKFGRDVVTRAKLSEAQVIELMKAIDNEQPELLAERFGIGRTQIYAIRRGRKWKFLQHHRSSANPENFSNP